MKLRAVIGEKFNMSQMPDRYGRMSAVTMVKVTPNTVVKTDTDKALVAFGVKKNISASLKGILRKTKNKTAKTLKELELGNDKVEVGDTVTIADVFRKGDLVDVTGISKGKGFAGVIKRHGFSGGPKTHGQSDRWRSIGSIGSGTTPGRVIKGLRMAGHMGTEQVTVAGLEILDIDTEENVLKIKGALPGNRGSVLILRKSIKRKKAYHEPEIPALPQLVKEENTQEASESGTEDKIPKSETPPTEQTGEVNNG